MGELVGGGSELSDLILSCIALRERHWAVLFDFADGSHTGGELPVEH